MKKWRCKICGEIIESDVRPDKCPRCKATGDVFEEVVDNKLAWVTEHVVGVGKAENVPEELNEKMGDRNLLAKTQWPVYDEAKTVESTIEIAVQVNGKLKGVVAVAADASEDDIKATAQADEAVAAALQGMNIVKVIVIRGKIVNFVVKPQ